MNFATYEFWKLLFLCYLASRVVIAAIGATKPAALQSGRKLCLLATAFILLGSESLLTLGCFLWVVLLGWLSLLMSAGRFAPGIKKILLIILLLAQLAPLFYYKYWNFVFNDVLGLAVRVPSVLIPMGLSFYTFQTIAFWVDNTRSPKPRPSFLNFLNFSSFFPQIVAGPIERRESLLPQIENVKYRIYRENLEPALQWIILGLAYKLVVADNIGGLSHGFEIDPANAWHVWFECAAFGLRIYFDFAGYSFIAVGLALIFGVRLTLNFRSPYWARDLREFWRNWHITLGAWLRDYIYLPLGGKRVRWWAANTLIVFVISGIWHGAGWGFLLWGLLHGVGVALASLPGRWLRPAPVSWFVTIGYVTGTWLYFFERDTRLLFLKTAAMVNPTAYSPSNAAEIARIFRGPAEAATTFLVIVVAVVALALERIGSADGAEPYRVARMPLASFVSIFLIVLLAPMEESSFIYFNF